MIEIEHIQSGSKGNCILVKQGGSCIGLDAGVPIKRMQREFRTKISDVDGWLVTHEHGDHCSQVPELLVRGAEVYMSPGTGRALGYASKDLNIIQHAEWFNVGDFRCTGFIVNHDAKEPFGFIVKGYNFKLCYISDTNGVPEFVRDFKGITHWMIECNYDSELLEDSQYHSALAKRIETSHMSIENVLELFTQVDLEKTKEIHLLHVSGRTGDKILFEKKLQWLTGLPVYT
jgi:phosphoribosyl 1,2-cyclic phosphodiesterase